MLGNIWNKIIYVQMKTVLPSFIYIFEQCQLCVCYFYDYFLNLNKVLKSITQLRISPSDVF